MMRTSLLFLVVAVAASCNSGGEAAGPSAKPAEPSDTAGSGQKVEPAGHAKEHTEHGTAKDEHADHAGGPQTLAMIMQGLSLNMQGLMAGLWAEDWPRVAREAKGIADHPHVSGDEKKRIIGILGDDFGAFVAHDKRVHGASVRLSEAASAGDRDAMLKELAVVQGGCVSCHTAFRKRLKTTPAVPR